MNKSFNMEEKKHSKNLLVRVFRRLFCGKKKKTGTTYPLR
ncbi:hypothetical protein EZJ58_4025 [Sodalis ligni]|uniref:Uncharacterized protein n=1 Tax=Sodalis ligni TaxID=2697027 RepID=A0A4R1NDY6_9GAMM|nr:hypothetical protein EZJ58_4025 [Sodalis ligni]